MFRAIDKIQPFTLMSALFLVMGQGQLPADGPESHWNQFRGPRGDGTAVSAELPVDFDESHKVPELGFDIG